MQRKISISIAGLPVEIEAVNFKFSNFVAAEYKLFLSNARPFFKIKIRENPFFRVKALKRMFQIKMEYKNGILGCDSGLFKGRIDIAKNKAFFESGGDRGTLETNSLQNILRVIYANILLDNKGVLLHSANIIKNKNGYLFFGKSDSGKTTVSRSFSKHGDILSDDIAVIRKVNRAYRVYGSPFWGMLGNELDPVNKSAPVKAAFRLIKADFNSVKKIDKKHALLNLVSCCSFIPKDGKTYKKAIDMLYDLTSNIPVYDLHFTKECDFWNLIG